MTLEKSTTNTSKNSGPIASTSSIPAAATRNTPTSFDRSNSMQTEQCRRSSMASSIGDSMDYQNQQESSLVSPVQRRASGPSNNKPKVDMRDRPSHPRLEREDSWGNMSIEDLL